LDRAAGDSVLRRNGDDRKRCARSVFQEHPARRIDFARSYFFAVSSSHAYNLRTPRGSAPGPVIAGKSLACDVMSIFFAASSAETPCFFNAVPFTTKSFRYV